MAANPIVDRVLDASGMSCTTLTPIVSNVLAELAPGALLEVRTDDPAAREAIPAWCRLTRNTLRESFEGPDQALGLDADQTIFHITKKEH
jgi:TusA-related sulfurtransferase